MSLGRLSLERIFANSVDGLSQFVQEASGNAADQSGSGIPSLSENERSSELGDAAEDDLTPRYGYLVSELG